MNDINSLFGAPSGLFSTPAGEKPVFPAEELIEKKFDFYRASGYKGGCASSRKEGTVTFLLHRRLMDEPFMKEIISANTIGQATGLPIPEIFSGNRYPWRVCDISGGDQWEEKKLYSTEEVIEWEEVPATRLDSSHKTSFVAARPLHHRFLPKLFGVLKDGTKVPIPWDRDFSHDCMTGWSPWPPEETTCKNVVSYYWLSPVVIKTSNPYELLRELVVGIVRAERTK